MAAGFVGTAVFLSLDGSHEFERSHGARGSRAVEEMQQTSLVAAVENALFLRHLRERIAQQEEIVLLGDAQDPVRMLRAVSEIQPDVLLLDAMFSTRDGNCCDSSRLAAIHEASPSTKIILLADSCSQSSVAKAMQLGARGCISSSALAEDCLRAVLAVDQGEIWLGRKELTYVLDDLLNQLESADDMSARFANVLSQRELDIASAVSMGLTNKEIARRLRISPTTVKSHLENIFHKLHVTHRVQLALLARSAAEQTESGKAKSHDTDQV